MYVFAISGCPLLFVKQTLPEGWHTCNNNNNNNDDNNNNITSSFVVTSIDEYCGGVGSFMECYSYFVYFWASSSDYFSSSQCSTTGVTKAVVCTILFMGWCI